MTLTDLALIECAPCSGSARERVDPVHMYALDRTRIGRVDLDRAVILDIQLGVLCLLHDFAGSPLPPVPMTVRILSPRDFHLARLRRPVSAQLGAGTGETPWFISSRM